MAMSPATTSPANCDFLFQEVFSVATGLDLEEGFAFSAGAVDGAGWLGFLVLVSSAIAACRFHACMCYQSSD